MRRLSALFLLLAGLLPVDRAVAQRLDYLPKTSNAALIGVNALVGGTTAAIHAWMRHGDIPKAFTLGVVGGTVHLGGKVLMARTNAGSWPGIVVSSVGTSMVANAGAGVSPFEEVAIPVGFLRLRVHTSRARKASLAVNLYEVGVVAVAAAYPGLTLDRNLSLRTGTFAFSSGSRRLRLNSDTVSGMSEAGIIILSRNYSDQERLARHEQVHAHQYWFMQGAIAQPIERSLRRHNRLMAKVPSWIELGVFEPAFAYAGFALFGKGGLYGLGENEAEILEIR